MCLGCDVENVQAIDVHSLEYALFLGRSQIDTLIVPEPAIEDMVVFNAVRCRVNSIVRAASEVQKPCMIKCYRMTYHLGYKELLHSANVRFPVS